MMRFFPKLAIAILSVPKLVGLMFSWTCAGLFLSVACLSGCATYSSYTCPEPIGKIVRQDCDDYRVRYESLQASLSVSVGSVSIGGALGSEQLRDPSELIQMMMHQTLALCHDYNACRIRNEEFSRRREEMDRTFTAVMAILDQLKAPNLSDSERKVMLSELVAILKPPRATAGGEDKHQKSLSTVEEKKKWKRNVFRRPDGFWLASNHVSPKAPAKGQPPRLIWVDSSYEKNRRPGGGFEWIRAYLWGNLSPDDDFGIIGPDGYKLLCKLRIYKEQPLAGLRCRAKRTERLPSLESLSLSYTNGETSRTISLGPLKPILDREMASVWMAYQPDPIDRDPVVRERPTIIMVSKIRGWQQFTARCWKDGKPVRSGDSSVLTGRVGTNTYSLLRLDVLPLPYTLAAGKDGYEPVEGDMQSSDAKGYWKCRLKLDGIPVREIKFRIDSNGLPQVEPVKKDSFLISPWWMLDTTNIPNSLEKKASGRT